MRFDRVRRFAVMIAVGAVFAALIPSVPAAATVPCRTIVGPVMYGVGTGPEYGACVNVIVGSGSIDNSFTVMAGATPTASGQPAYIWVYDSVCSWPAFCVFTGAGATKNGTQVGADAFVCYIDQLGQGFCTPDIGKIIETLLQSIDPIDIEGVKEALKTLDTGGVSTF